MFKFIRNIFGGNKKQEVPKARLAVPVKQESVTKANPTTVRIKERKKQVYKNSKPVGRVARSYTHYHYHDGRYYDNFDIEEMIYLGIIMANSISSYGKTYEEVYPESILSKPNEESNSSQEEQKKTDYTPPVFEHVETNSFHKNTYHSSPVEESPSRHESSHSSWESSHHSSSHYDSSPSYDSSSSYDSGSSCSSSD